MELDLGRLKQAGSIASSVRKSVSRIVRPGVRASEVCERVESLIVELGGLPAFPCNISVNDVAAHYTPSIGDDLVIDEKALVKIDVGVHVEGYIADTAVTIDLSGEYSKLVEASERALEAALSVVKPYVSLYEIGRAVENEIRKLGFKPIRNLSGHTIERYVLHAGVSVPNYADRSLFNVRLAPGTLLALEPFATNGRGFTVEKSVVNIYSYTGRRKTVLSGIEELVVSAVSSRYGGLPFTPRWLRDLGVDSGELLSAVRSLHAKGVLRGYPVLVEAGGGMVSQAEHTVYIGDGEVVVTTA